jgi:hypothetical protein
MNIVSILQSRFLQDIGSYTVDDYQGRVNKIIILSTVRLNIKGEIGFVDTANRITVMLSRSTKCFYFEGNFNCLKNKSDSWHKINGLVNLEAKYGVSIPIRCNIHDANIKVQAPEGLLNLNGGCDRQCKNLKKCQKHMCLEFCHPNMDHSHERQFICKDKCGNEIYCDICKDHSPCGPKSIYKKVNE